MQPIRDRRALGSFADRKYREPDRDSDRHSSVGIVTHRRSLAYQRGVAWGHRFAYGHRRRCDIDPRWNGSGGIAVAGRDIRA